MSDAERFLCSRGVSSPVAHLLVHGKHGRSDIHDLLYLRPCRSTNFPDSPLLELGVGGAAWLGEHLRMRCRDYGADGFPSETLVCGMGPAFNGFLDLLLGCQTFSCRRPRDFGHFLCHLFRHISFFDRLVCTLGAQYVNVLRVDPAEAARRVILIVCYHLLNRRKVHDSFKLVALGVKLRYGGRAFVAALYQECQMPYAVIHRERAFGPLHTFPPLSRGSYGNFDAMRPHRITKRPTPVRNAHYDFVYGSVFWWLLCHDDFKTARRLALSAKHFTYLFRAFFPEFIGCTHCGYNALRARTPWNWLTTGSHFKFDSYQSGALLMRWRHSHSNALVGVMPALNDQGYLAQINGWEVEPFSRISRMVTLSIASSMDETMTRFF